MRRQYCVFSPLLWSTLKNQPAKSLALARSLAYYTVTDNCGKCLYEKNATSSRSPVGVGISSGGWALCEIIDCTSSFTSLDESADAAGKKIDFLSFLPGSYTVLYVLCLRISCFTFYALHFTWSLLRALPFFLRLPTICILPKSGAIYCYSSARAYIRVHITSIFFKYTFSPGLKVVN